MRKNSYLPFFGCCLVLICMVVMISGQIYAAEVPDNGNYLKYQEPTPASSSSWFSTIAYIFSLLITFALIIALAYFASRFLGHKIGNLSALGHNKIHAALSLGSNRTIYVVEVAGKFLIVGVTEHSINLLHEITSQEEIERLILQPSAGPTNQFDIVFQRHIASLQQMSHKFAAVFDTHSKTQSESENEREKR